VADIRRTAIAREARRAHNVAVVQSHRAWRMRLDSLEMRMRAREMRQVALEHRRG
jgi:hypothetical protein